MAESERPLVNAGGHKPGGIRHSYLECQGAQSVEDALAAQAILLLHKQEGQKSRAAEAVTRLWDHSRGLAERIERFRAELGR